MRFILSLLSIAVFWSLDSYKDMLYFNLTFIDAATFNFAEANPLIRIVITLSILFFTMVQVKNQEKISTKCTATNLKMFDSLKKISEIILSPLPLHKQLNSVVNMMEETLEIKTAFVGSYKKDSIFTLNTNESLSRVGILDKYLPHHGNLIEGSLDSLLSICFLEKRTYVDDFINIKGIKYRAIIQAYGQDKLKKALGIVAIITDKDDSDDYSNFLLKVCEQIAFSVQLTKKKDDMIVSQNKFNEEFSVMDTQLQIPNNSKVQEMIEHEIKRSQRYGTSISLMLIEIDHMQNLSNIFTEKETLTLRKEVASFFKKQVRETDLFAKWTAQSFVIVAPDVDFRATKSFANKLIRNLKEQRFSKVGKITCSYGITSFSAKDSIGDFRKRAENALQEAIRRGGNSIEVKILV